MWFGDDNTMQGLGGPEGTDGQLYQWVEGNRWAGQRSRLLAMRETPGWAGALRTQRRALFR
jgi:hypothetical protein